MTKIWSIPDRVRVYAVGDVHGYLDVLQRMHDRIVEDIHQNPVNDPVVIFLGDYVDRGPDSAGVLDFLIFKNQNAKNSQNQTKTKTVLEHHIKINIL